MSNREILVSAFSQDELSSLVSAMAAYIVQRDEYNMGSTLEKSILDKLVDGMILSNYLNVEPIDEEVSADSNAPMGSAEYKAYEAMYESDVLAHR